MEAQLDPAIPQVLLDGSKFKQVLYNYLSNAIKFTPEKGRVDIRISPEGEHGFRLEVEDTGIGVAPSDKHKLFIEFQQLDSSSAKKHAGTGLGLALTKRLVEAQGGTGGIHQRTGQGKRLLRGLPPRNGKTMNQPKSDTKPLSREVSKGNNFFEKGDKLRGFESLCWIFLKGSYAR